MSISQAILPEFEHEMANTRKVLECLPDDKLEWKADPTFNSIGWVGAHLAEIVGWVEGVLKQESWDVNPVGGEPYKSPVASSRKQVLECFDKGVVAAKAAIMTTTDAEFAQIWSLKSAGEAIFTMPRVAVIRTFVINHTIHHRAILCMYLRLNGVPVPGMYGPSGDAK